MEILKDLDRDGKWTGLFVVFSEGKRIHGPATLEDCEEWVAEEERRNKPEVRGPRP